MNARQYRLVMVGLGLVFVAVVALAIALMPEGDGAGLPDPVEAVFPGQGDAVLTQVSLQIDMQVGYAIDLEIDGVPIPPAEVDFVEATGVYTWTPGNDTVFSTWTPGRHEVRISWDRVAGLPDQGNYQWTFRVQG